MNTVRPPTVMLLHSFVLAIFEPLHLHRGGSETISFIEGVIRVYMLQVQGYCNPSKIDNLLDCWFVPRATPTAHFATEKELRRSFEATGLSHVSFLTHGSSVLSLVSSSLYLFTSVYLSPTPSLSPVPSLTSPPSISLGTIAIFTRQQNMHMITCMAIFMLIFTSISSHLHLLQIITATFFFALSLCPLSLCIFIFFRVSQCLS